MRCRFYGGLADGAEVSFPTIGAPEKENPCTFWVGYDPQSRGEHGLVGTIAPTTVKGYESYFYDGDDYYGTAIYVHKMLYIDEFISAIEVEGFE